MANQSTLGRPNLLALPLELRLVIWKYVIFESEHMEPVSDDPLNVERICKISPEGKCAGILQLAPICLVNKAVYDDAIDLAYAHAQFSFEYINIRRDFGEALRNKLQYISMPLVFCDWIGINLPSLPNILAANEHSILSQTFITTCNLPALRHLEICITEPEEEGSILDLYNHMIVTGLIYFKAKFKTTFSINMNHLSAVVRENGSCIYINGHGDVMDSDDEAAMKDDLGSEYDSDDSESSEAIREYWQVLHQEQISQVRDFLCLGDPSSSSPVVDTQTTLKEIFRSPWYDWCAVPPLELLRRDDLNKILPLINKERLKDFKAIWQRHIFQGE